MTNLTLSLDDELVKRARIRAIEEGTSLSAKVREFLAVYTQQGTPMQATTPPSAPAQPIDPATELLQLMAQVRAEARHEAAADTGATHMTLREQTYAEGFRQHT